MTSCLDITAFRFFTPLIRMPRIVIAFMPQLVPQTIVAYIPRLVPQTIVAYMPWPIVACMPWTAPWLIMMFMPWLSFFGIWLDCQVGYLSRPWIQLSQHCLVQTAKMKHQDSHNFISYYTQFFFSFELHRKVKPICTSNSHLLKNGDVLIQYKKRTHHFFYQIIKLAGGTRTKSTLYNDHYLRGSINIHNSTSTRTQNSVFSFS